MKKILYITDQEEYSQNGTLTALFDNYLREYFNIDFVFITKYKFSFQIKDNHFIVPAINEENVVEYLESKDIDISSYNFIFVRNKKKIFRKCIKK
jgi:HD superfamily phosphohydrolase YqeK